MDLDRWLPDPAVRIAHARETTAAPGPLWHAATQVRLRDAGLLGRLIRWRIPGTTAELSFDELFHDPPFLVLDEPEGALVSGLVGKIWTLRSDYPRLEDAEQFRCWDAGGTAQVVFANWVEPRASGSAALLAEVRVRAFGVQGRIGMAALAPLIGTFQNLVGSEGIAAAVRIAERR